MIFPSRSQLASKQIRRTGRAEAVTKEGSDATLPQHVSPIEWYNVILYGQYVLDRALGPLATGPYVVFQHQSGRYPIPIIHGTG